MNYSGRIFEKKGDQGSVLIVAEPDDSGELEALPIAQAETGHSVKLPGGDFARLDRRLWLSAEELGAERETLKDEVLTDVLRDLVLRDARRHYEHVHETPRARPYRKGDDFINYAGRVFDQEEVLSLVDSSLEFFLTAKRYDRLFCQRLAASFRTPGNFRMKVLSTNSGSSSNLLAVSSLTSPRLGEQALKRGDEVITVAAGFPTTVAPLLQYGLVPVFVDINLGTYNIEDSLIQAAVSEKTKAIVIAHTLGVPFNLDRVLDIAEKHDLWVVEDNCDALGAEYSLEREYVLKGGKKVSGTGWTGTFGHIGTTSFYPAHHITMGEGGAVFTSDVDLYRVLMSMRDWGRDCYCPSGKDNTCGKRFDWSLGDLPHGYDHKYIYSHMGYNLKITEMQAAVGAAQLKKLPSFVEARRANWRELYDGFRELEEFFILPTFPESANPSPFGFVLTVREDSPFSRDEITKHLEEKKIQTRTVFAGNMLRQPAFVDGNYEHRISGSLENTDAVMSRTFWLGVYPGLKPGMIDYILEKSREFVEARVSPKV